MLNDLVIRKLSTPASGVSQHPDGRIPGFGVRVTPNGVKSFYLTYRKDGRSRRLTLGRYPITTLQEARAKALAALSEIAEGGDPAPQPEPSPVAKFGGEGFAGVLDLFVANHCRRHNRASTAQETERLLRAQFLPLWTDRPLAGIGKVDVVAALEPAMRRGAPASARHAFVALRTMMNWAVAQGLLETSPCAGMRPPAKSVERERVLTDDELGRVSMAAAEMGYPYGAIVRLLILTAQRRGEVTAMRWDEVDLDAGLWRIPADKTKNSRAHAVPLGPSALATLRALPRLGSPLVFPASGRVDRPYSGFSKHKARIDRLSGVSDWTLHDLRRTAATGMARLGVEPHVGKRFDGTVRISA